ncbi:MAG: TIGR04255 family protein [Nevskia sp.]|nr:TIGR04255 family protein [Nevskia sp.]
MLRLDFASVPALQSDRQPALSERIQERFPSRRTISSFQLTFSPGADSQSGAMPQPVTTGWIWQHGTTDTFSKIVALSHNFLSLEYGAEQYSDSRDFLDNFVFVHRVFCDLYRVDPVNRIGLRFINQIKLDQGSALDWTGIIRPDLVAGVLGGLPPDMRLTRSMHQLLAVQDDVNLVLNYGLFNTEYPNPIARRNFVLDLDFSISGEIRSGDLLARIADLNQRGENLFESIIENGLREIMVRIE